MAPVPGSSVFEGRTRPDIGAGRDPAGKIGRLAAEIDAILNDDEEADRRITGAWKTFDDINAAAHDHAWDAYSIDLSVDAASYRRLDREQRRALLGIFGT